MRETMLARVFQSAFGLIRRPRPFLRSLIVLAILGLVGPLLERFMPGAAAANARPALGVTALLFVITIAYLWAGLGLKNVAMAALRGADDAAARMFYPPVKLVLVIVLGMLPGLALGVGAMIGFAAMQQSGSAGPVVVAILAVATCLVATLLSQVVFLVLDGRAGAMDAYVASTNLTKGFRLEAFVVLLVCEAPPLILSIGVLLAAARGNPPPAAAMGALSIAGHLVFNCLWTVFSAALAAALYLELVARQEKSRAGAVEDA